MRTRAEENAIAQRVRCPLCERRPGFPCQALNGLNNARVHVIDDYKGGTMGGRDCNYPHRQRLYAAREQLWPDT